MDPCRSRRFCHPRKNEIKPWLKEQWCIPPQAKAEFVAAMEDVLDLYAEAYDPRYPTVCLDEKPVVLHDDTRPPLPAVARRAGAARPCRAA